MPHYAAVALCALGATAFLDAPLSASTVTFSFQTTVTDSAQSGELSGWANIQPGDTISGTFSFDSDTPLHDVTEYGTDRQGAFWASDEFPMTLTLSVNGYAFNAVDVSSFFIPTTVRTMQEEGYSELDVSGYVTTAGWPFDQNLTAGPDSSVLGCLQAYVTGTEDMLSDYKSLPTSIDNSKVSYIETWLNPNFTTYDNALYGWTDTPNFQATAPEPASFALAGMGAALLLIGRLRGRPRA